jgi:cytochrome c
MKYLAVAAAMMALAAPAFAEGDAAKGESDFKKCKSCHAIVAPDGTEIVKGGKVGPNLWGLDGKTVGSTEDFKYGDSIVAVGAAGVVWDAEQLEKYVADPAAWLKEASGDDKAKSKMTYKLAKGGEDMAAYLVSIK